MSTEVYRIVTDKIISALEKNCIPWANPWNGRMGRPRNAISQKCYRGINALITSTWISGYHDPHWYTRNQVKKLDLRLKKDQKYTPIVYWNWREKKQPDGMMRNIAFARYYQCFNREQIEGHDQLWPPQEIGPLEDWENSAEDILEGYLSRGGPEIKHGATGAWYVPSTDLIELPDREHFVSAAEYWSTMYHEAVHSTGAAKRLDRGLRKSLFGDHSYSKEELIAEMGTCFLLADLGVEKHFDNSVNYISGWLEKLKSDRKFLIQAAQGAEKACDHIKGVTYDKHSK